MKTILAFLLLTVGVMCLDAQRLAAEAARFNEVGTIVTDPNKGPAAMSRSKARLRRFIWKHWHSHSRGRITWKGNTIEGVPFTFTYTIDQDDKTVWRVAIDARGTNFDPSQGKSEPWSRKFEAYEIVRYRLGNTDNENQVIPDKESLPATEYFIVFRDKAGEEKNEL